MSILCLDGKRHIIEIYKEKASALREFIRTNLYIKYRTSSLTRISYFRNDPIQI
jgi:hypothetical protein